MLARIAVFSLVFVASTAAWADQPGYTLDTPIQTIAADPHGAEVLNRDMPGLLSNSNYDIFKGLSLKQVRAMSGGRLTQETMAQTEADLKTLPATQKISYRRN